MSMPGTVDLEATGLQVRLGGVPVLRDIALTLRPGELVGLIGPNGAGKSTLLRALLNLLPPAAGQVLVDGRDARAVPPRDLARLVSYLPQGHLVHWPLAVERLVALGRLPHLAPYARLGQADADAVTRAMARADVVHLAGRPANRLSGGERARVLLARALAAEAPALLADEPVTSLDPYHQLQVMELLRDLAAEGRLVVVVLHDLTLAGRFCDRLVVLDRGRIAADGPPRSVLEPGLLGRVYGVQAVHAGVEGMAYVLPWRRLPPGEREEGA